MFASSAHLQDARVAQARLRPWRVRAVHWRDVARLPDCTCHTEPRNAAIRFAYEDGSVETLELVAT